MDFRNQKAGELVESSLLYSDNLHHLRQTIINVKVPFQVPQNLLCAALKTFIELNELALFEGVGGAPASFMEADYVNLEARPCP